MQNDLNQISVAALTYIAKNGWHPLYLKTTQKGLLRHILRAFSFGASVSGTIIVNSLKLSF